MTGEELFLANLAAIERASKLVARQAKLSPEDAADLDATFKLRLVENHYAILTKFEGRSQMVTYLAIVCRRLYLDELMHEHGRWRASAEARRLGRAAVDLEELLQRRRMSFDEAVAGMRILHPSLTKDQMAAIAARLPPRGDRASFVHVEHEIEAPDETATAESSIIEEEAAAAGKEVSDVVRSELEKLTPEDRVALSLRFRENTKIADVARFLQCDAKKLYRRQEGILRKLRDQLRRAGFVNIELFIGRPDPHLDFGLDAEKPPPRQPMTPRGSGNDEVSP